MQVNLLNLDEKDCQINLYSNKKIGNESVECRQQRLANQRQYEKEKMQMNLLNVANRDCKHIKSLEKYFK